MVNQARLEEILGALEDLQNASTRASQQEQDAMSSAKNRLMEILK